MGIKHGWAFTPFWRKCCFVFTDFHVWKKIVCATINQLHGLDPNRKVPRIPTNIHHYVWYSRGKKPSGKWLHLQVLNIAPPSTLPEPTFLRWFVHVPEIHPRKCFTSCFLKASILLYLQAKRNYRHPVLKETTGFASYEGSLSSCTSTSCRVWKEANHRQCCFRRHWMQRYHHQQK